MLLITVKCSGCKKEGDYIVSQEQHSAPCQFCPQHVSFNFKEGLVIDGLCTACHRPLDAPGHIWSGDKFTQCNRAPKEK